MFADILKIPGCLEKNKIPPYKILSSINMQLVIPVCPTKLLFISSHVKTHPIKIFHESFDRNKWNDRCCHFELCESCRIRFQKRRECYNNSNFDLNASLVSFKKEVFEPLQSQESLEDKKMHWITGVVALMLCMVRF